MNNSETQELNKWKYDSDYISYVQSGESSAVFVTRDIVNSIDTTGMWIDIVSMSRYTKGYSANAFNWIVVELLPRLTTPQYKKPRFDDDYAVQEYNRYETWRVAHNDIDTHRRKGTQGKKFIILCDLHLKTTGKNSRDYKEDCTYIIRKVSKITDQEIKYIEDNYYDLIDDIIENKKPTLEILNVKHKPVGFSKNNKKKKQKNIRLVKRRVASTN